jgi:hypothetical protein
MIMTMALTGTSGAGASGAEAWARTALSARWEDAAFQVPDAQGGVQASSVHLDLFGGASDRINAAAAVDAAGTEKISPPGDAAIAHGAGDMPVQTAMDWARSQGEDYVGADIAAALIAYNDIGGGMLGKTGVTGLFASYEPGGDGAALHVPEPSSFAIVAFGLIIVAILRRRRWFRA